MQYSEDGYRQFASPPATRGVRYSWIGEAWGIYRRGFLPWLVLYLIAGAPVLLAGLGVALGVHYSENSDSDSSSPSSTAFDVSMFILVGGLFLSLLFLVFTISCCSSGIGLRQTRGEVVRPGEIFQGMTHWIAQSVFSLMFLASLAAGIFGCGLGIFTACGLLMPASGLVSLGESGGRAFSRSVAAMKGDWAGASVFCFVFALISAAGTALTLGAGILVFVPMMYIISGLAYRDCIDTPGQGPKVIDLSELQASGVWPPPLYPEAYPGTSGQGQ